MPVRRWPRRKLVEEPGVGYQETRVVPMGLDPALAEDFFNTQGPVAADPRGRESMLPAELNAYTGGHRGKARIR